MLHYSQYFILILVYQMNQIIIFVYLFSILINIFIYLIAQILIFIINFLCSHTSDLNWFYFIMPLFKISFVEILIRI